MEEVAANKKRRFECQYLTLERAQRELEEARQRVAHLEASIEKMHITAEEKEKSNHVVLIPKPETSGVYSLLQGYALQSILGFLGSGEVFSCSRVCKQWARDIDQNVWKEAARNQAPRLLKDIEDRNKRLGQKDALKYKTLAMSQICRPSLHTDEIIPKLVSELKAQDVFVVVEAIHLETKNVVGSWSMNLEKLKIEGSSFLLEMENAVQKSSYPLPDIADRNLPDVSFSIRLFRCDNGQHFCLAYEHIGSRTSRLGCAVASYSNTVWTSQFANTRAGALSKHLLSLGGEFNLRAFMGCTARCNFSLDTSTLHLQSMFLRFADASNDLAINTEQEDLLVQNFLIILEGLEWQR